MFLGSLGRKKNNALTKKDALKRNLLNLIQVQSEVDKNYFKKDQTKNEFVWNVLQHFKAHRKEYIISKTQNKQREKQQDQKENFVNGQTQKSSLFKWKQQKKQVSYDHPLFQEIELQQDPNQEQQLIENLNKNLKFKISTKKEFKFQSLQSQDQSQGKNKFLYIEIKKDKKNNNNDQLQEDNIFRPKIQSMIANFNELYEEQKVSEEAKEKVQIIDKNNFISYFHYYQYEIEQLVFESLGYYHYYIENEDIKITEEKPKKIKERSSQRNSLNLVKNDQKEQLIDFTLKENQKEEADLEQEDINLDQKDKSLQKTQPNRKKQYKSMWLNQIHSLLQQENLNDKLNLGYYKYVQQISKSNICLGPSESSQYNLLSQFLRNIQLKMNVDLNHEHQQQVHQEIIQQSVQLIFKL